MLIYFLGLLTPLSYIISNREHNRFSRYKDGERFPQSRSQTRSSPTIFEYFFNKLKLAFNSNKRRSLIQNRRLKLDRSTFRRQPNYFHAHRHFNSDYDNSVLVECGPKSRRWLDCSERFPYGHLRCCSVLRGNHRRYR